MEKNVIKLSEIFSNIKTKYDGSENLFFLGVDGGATKTRAVVLNLKNQKVTYGSSGPSNHEVIGLHKSIVEIKKAVHQALRRMDISHGDISFAVFAIAGITTQQHKELFHQKFRNLFPKKKCAFHNDVVAAWAAGTMCKPGIAIIAGTGSNLFGVNNKGRTWQVGGWGHILGDEGSAYWISLYAIRKAIDFYDGIGKKTSLLKSFLKFYRLASVEDALNLFYQNKLSKDEIAAFSKCVYAEACNGDRLAKQIFKDAGTRLGISTITIVKKLKMQRDKFPVALIGSVFKSGPCILPTFIKTLHLKAPYAYVPKSALPPVGGAVLLALTMHNLEKLIDLKKFRKKLDAMSI